MHADRPALVLASTSRYRRELLARLAIPFEVLAPDVDETPRPGEDARALAMRLALEKARAVARRRPDALVIGSDQAAQLGDAILNKPGTHEGAVAQLSAAAGREAVFHTAVALVHGAGGRAQQETVPTRVRYRAFDAVEIAAYLAAEPAHDCAGSAKVEGLGIALLESVESPDPTALIGLPLIAVCRMLREAGLPPLAASGRRAGA
jgi:septum formation protein